MVPVRIRRQWARAAAAAALAAVGGCSSGAVPGQSAASGTIAAAGTQETAAGMTAATGTTGAGGSGGVAGCSAITMADLTSVGLRPDLAKPTASPVDQGQGAYCVYTKTLGADGIEFDWWRNDSPVETWQNVLAGATYPGGIGSAGLAGVTDSMFSPGAVSGGPRFATIMVRRGDLVFDISAPAGPDARGELSRLALIALGRLASA